jgi:hypothetical protein
VYITVIAIAVFMFGMMQLSAKTPSKIKIIKIKKIKMFNKGDKVSVLDEAISGVVVSTKDKSYDRNRGRIHDDIFCQRGLS